MMTNEPYGDGPDRLSGSPGFRPVRSLRLVLFALILSQSATAQFDNASRYEEDHGKLWERGEYARALEALGKRIALFTGYPPLKYIRDRAELRFAVGDIDEAIEDMEFVAEEHPEPSHSLRLALMYRYRGRMDSYATQLRYAAMLTEGRRWRYSRRDQNFVAIGRIAELLGENPKNILNIHYGILLEGNPGLTAVQVAAGDLARRKAGYDLAAEHYLQALKFKPSNQDALAGLAECYWKSHDGRLEKTLQKLLNLNPNHPRAHAIEAEQFLDLGKTAEALKVIEEALAINPKDLRFQSLQSAALFIDGETLAAEALQEKVLEFNPVCSEIFRTTGRIASRHYRFKEGAEFQRRALEVNPDDHQARALYTLDLMRLGRETQGIEELEKAFEADPYNVHLFNLLELADTLKTFTSVERGAFVLRLPAHEAPVLAGDALNLLDDAIERFEKKYDVELEKPVLVEMFDNHDDFMVRSVGLPGNAGHLGICFGKLVTMDTPSARPKGSSNWRAVLWHEFMHVITLQKTKNRLPRWLSEGISVYEEAQYAPAWRIRLDPGHMKILAEEGLPGLRDMGAFFTQPKSPEHLMFGYFIAAEFVTAYVQAHGFEALVSALTAIGQGRKAEEALVEAADTSRRKLDKTFHAYLEERLKPFDNLPPTEQSGNRFTALFKGLTGPDEEGETPPRIQEVDHASPFTDAIEKADRAAEEERWDVAVQALEEAHALFPDYAGPNAPLRRLAQLFERNGNREALKGILQRQMEWNPTELEACVRLVELFREDGDWEGIVLAADWALGIDPYDVSLRRALAEALVRSFREDEALDALETLAHLDSAHAVDHRVQRVTILAKRGEYAPAKSEIIEVLEEVPHYWKAQRLLLDIVEQQTLAEQPSP